MKATLILAGILELIAAVLLLLGGNFLIQGPSQSSQLNPQILKVSGIAYIVLGLGYIITAIGLFCRKKWARIITLLTGICIFAYAFLVGIITTVTSYGTAYWTAPAIAMMWAMLLPFLGIGAWWTWAFRAAKMAALIPPSTSLRPTSISAIAIIKISNILFLPLIVYVAVFPAMGLLLEGLASQLYVGVLLIVSFVLGVGLWRLQEWARIGSLILYGYGFLNSVLFYVRPEALNVYVSTVRSQMGLPATQVSHPIWGLGMGVVILGIFCYFLITRRAAFKKRV
ncbi:MAG: hypothetical protein COV45_06135 [Deltaproteobacteria bacterium CG11_big_fil_rev_8_21_14_0_20_47_16]|nr:MAG: hypothetical protein COV45_06135 [Deltaproteobacteria bacterium CG11_big_fil_rev_8_21_14_0_20_47_16]